MPAPRRSFSNLFSSLVLALKAVPEDKLDDILDVIPGDDQWNTGGRLPTKAELNVGPGVDASGDGGRELAMRHSDPQEGDKLTDQYAAIAAMMFDRVNEVEKGQKAIARLLGQM